MEPRPRGRGSSTARDLTRASESASMEPRPRGRGSSAKAGWPGRCSNELKWSRDHVVADRPLFTRKGHRVMWLQWSRDHVVADRWGVMLIRAVHFALQWSRDHVVADRRLGGVSTARRAVASMEPRPRGRGSG